MGCTEKLFLLVFYCKVLIRSVTFAKLPQALKLLWHRKITTNKLINRVFVSTHAQCKVFVL